MKICAMTMVHRDHWALSQWYRHFAAQLGGENLFVLAHGADPRIAEICPEASILTLPRDGFAHFDRRRGAALNAFQAGLLNYFDWVIRTDADELICHDPALYTSLPEAIAAQGRLPVLSALGFDLVEMPGDAPLEDAPVFERRRHLAFSGHYSKACAIRRPVELVLHGVKVPARRVETFPFCMPEGLYLAHLKYANLSALDAATQIRMQVGGAPEPGVPGTGWSAARADGEAFLARFADKPELPWEKARAKAYRALSQKPARLVDPRIVKVRALKFDFRTQLPEAFGAR